jgi:hypothetical protein
VQTSWRSGEADIPTFQLSELLATKLRAIYQRSKGAEVPAIDPREQSYVW